MDKVLFVREIIGSKKMLDEKDNFSRFMEYDDVVNIFYEVIKIMEENGIIKHTPNIETVDFEKFKMINNTAKFNFSLPKANTKLNTPIELDCMGAHCIINANKKGGYKITISKPSIYEIKINGE